MNPDPLGLAAYGTYGRRVGGFADGGGVSTGETPSMANNYNTRLTPSEETAFQSWISAQSAAAGRDLSKDMFDYDLRGAWKNNAQAAENGHLPDTYKKPNHPTFSDQSIYNGVDGQSGGTWQDMGNGKFSFVAAPTNLQMQTPAGLQSYFQRAEPGNTLVMPNSQASGAGLASSVPGYADGGGIGNGNGENEGKADGEVAAHDVGPGSYDSAGAPSYGIDGGLATGAAAATPGFWGSAASMLGKAGMSALGVAGPPGAMLNVGLSAATHGGTPTASSLGGLFGSAVGAIGGPLGSMVGGTIGSLAGDYLGRHADPNATQEKAAAAGAGVNRGDYAGPGSEWMNNPLMTSPPAAAQPMAQGLATGGVPAGRGHPALSRLSHGSALVPGASMGRADAIQTEVPQDAYVVPADVVSGLGQGNTQAGGKRLSGMLASEFKPQGYAGGGAVKMIPVRLSGGEFVVHPAHCAHLGGGDVKRGHAELDTMVASVRKSAAKHAMSAPPPK